VANRVEQPSAGHWKSDDSSLHDSFVPFTKLLLHRVMPYGDHEYHSIPGLENSHPRDHCQPREASYPRIEAMPDHVGDILELHSVYIPDPEHFQSGRPSINIQHSLDLPRCATSLQLSSSLSVPQPKHFLFLCPLDQSGCFHDSPTERGSLNFWTLPSQICFMLKALRPLSKVSPKLTAVSQTPTWEVSTLTRSDYRPTDTQEKRCGV
jgi:hypothetical protein